MHFSEKSQRIFPERKSAFFPIFQPTKIRLRGSYMTESKKSQWRAWLYAAGIRALKTFAQAFIACMPVTAATIGQVDWLMAASTACVAAVLSILTSVAGIPEAASPWADEEKLDGQHGREA